MRENHLFDFLFISWVAVTFAVGQTCVILYAMTREKNWVKTRMRRLKLEDQIKIHFTFSSENQTMAPTSFQCDHSTSHQHKDKQNWMEDRPFSYQLNKSSCWLLNIHSVMRLSKIIMFIQWRQMSTFFLYLQNMKTSRFGCPCISDSMCAYVEMGRNVVE